MNKKLGIVKSITNIQKQPVPKAETPPPTEQPTTPRVTKTVIGQDGSVLTLKTKKGI